MSRYILHRLLGVVPLLFGVTLLTFGISNLVPGSPVSDLAAQQGDQQAAGSLTSRQEDLDRIRRNLGLDQPVHIRYFTWIGNLLRGDFGISMRNYTSVGTLILDKLPNTLLLTTTAFLLSFVAAIPIGIYAAVKRNSVFDHSAGAASVAGYSVPTFWLALMVIFLVSLKFREWGLPYLPAGGAYDFRAGGDFLDRMEHLILPALTLAFVQVATWTRYIRSQMLEVLAQDYIRTAHAKGLGERLVIYRHGLRNALLPLITLLGLAIPELFGGALIIEQIFNYPGIGQLTFDAAINKDYPLIMATVLFASTLVIFGNLIADVLYGIVDPRVRH